MLNKLKSFIAKYQLLESNDRLILAVSGGKDSVAMAHLFHRLDYNFAIAHCNFKLRARVFNVLFIHNFYHVGMS